MNLDRAALRQGATAAGRGVHLGAHLLIPVVFVAIGATLYLSVDEINLDVCTRENKNLPDLGLGVAGLAGLVAGRFLSWIGQHASPDEGEQRMQRSRSSSVFGQGALAVTLLLLVPLWVIEALGTVHVPIRQTTLEPMTYYIRCAILNDKEGSGIGVSSIAIIFFVCLVVGHWLWGWHPRTSQRLERLGVTKSDVDRSAV